MTTCTASQQQTKEIFGYKWGKRETYESEIVYQESYHWLVERYCNGDHQKVAEWLKGGEKTILDAGCGAGLSALLLFGEQLRDHHYIGMDISSSIEVAKKRFLEREIPGTFIQANILEAPFEDESIDIVFSEGVLHHTDSTEKAIQILSKKIKKGGLFLFYIYAKKGPIREFTDDYIRNYMKDMPNDDAWDALKPLTKLGMTLGELDIKVDVPEDIPYLGIKKGPIDIQRLFYWHFCKMFHRPGYTIEENNHINFDWYRPLNCHRQTIEETREFCKNSNLEILDENLQESGFTIIARKK